jgi:hypothetical protein
MTDPRPPKKLIAPSRLRVIAIVGYVVWAVCLRATTLQSPTVTTATVSLPPELAAPVAAALATDVVTVTTGTVKLEFWWVKSLPLRVGGSAAPSWADVADGSLVGALRLGANWTDIRGYTIRPGVYTLRFALQPQNGDHMGISPHREFLLPAPAADDVALDPVGFEGAVALARKSSRRAHPASISIDPPAATAPPLSATTSDLSHKVVIVSVPTSAGPLTFGIVVDGSIDH